MRIFAVSQRQSGFMALTTMVILGMVLLFIVVSSFSVTIGAADSELTKRSSRTTQLFAEDCAEEVLYRLYVDDALPTGVTLPVGSCAVQSLGEDGSVVDFSVSGSLGTTHHTITLSVDTTPPMSILSWEEY